MLRVLTLTAVALGSVPGQETKILQAMWYNKQTHTRKKTVLSEGVYPE